MGRGRQKAKQTKVARELKYHSSSIDVESLQRELTGAPVQPPPAVVDDVEEDDQYSAYYVDDDDDDGPSSRYASAAH